jgi:hypothetical protein
MEVTGVFEAQRRELEEAAGKAAEDWRWEAADGAGEGGVGHEEEEEGEEGGDAQEEEEEEEEDDGDFTSLEAQLLAVGKELEAKRRRLGLVEATEQQLASQAQEALHESGPPPSPGKAGMGVRP